MSPTWIMIIGCAVVTAASKASGALMLGTRELPTGLVRVVAFLAPALLAAMAVTNTVADGRHIQVGANLFGVLAAGVVMWRKGSILVAVLIAALVTALLRLVA